MSEEIDFRDIIYNKGNYLADGKELMRARLEVVTEDGHVFYVHCWDYRNQKTRIKKK